MLRKSSLLTIASLFVLMLSVTGATAQEPQFAAAGTCPPGTSYVSGCDVASPLGEIDVLDIQRLASKYKTTGTYTEAYWSLTGNADTGPNTNFLGTTDSQPLIFKTTGAEAIRIDTTGQVGVGTDLPEERLHVVGNIRLDSDLICTDCINSENIADGQVGSTDVDTDQIQQRVTDTCAAGSAISAINADGTVTCENVNGGDGGGSGGLTLTFYEDTSGDRSSWRSPYFLDSGIAFTVISILNSGIADTTITVSFYDETGSLLADTTTILGAGEVWTPITESGGGVAGTANQHGSIEITSSSGDVLPWGAITMP